MPRYVDRTFAKMIAIKRLVTGSLALLCGIGFVVMISMLDDRKPPPFAYATAAIFLGVGGWALHDGIRFFRNAKKTKED